MTERVPSSEIERIVGMKRHPEWHYARAVSDQRTVYILHSGTCLAHYDDLRECPYSLALDEGIDEMSWSGSEDRPVLVTIQSGLLVPVPELDEGPLTLVVFRTCGQCGASVGCLPTEEGPETCSEHN